MFLKKTHPQIVSEQKKKVCKLKHAKSSKVHPDCVFMVHPLSQNYILNRFSYARTHAALNHSDPPTQVL